MLLGSLLQAVFGLLSPILQTVTGLLSGRLGGL
jgi:hypothetical protein